LEFSELDDTPIKNYSSGMHAGLGFALAVQLNPDVLLVDEVLAVGDEAFQQKCMDQIDGSARRAKPSFCLAQRRNRQGYLRPGVPAGSRPASFFGKAAEAIERYH
jgi:ABC-type polysaccharide/polyol phosphate transport system ATPase subunit